MAIAEKSKKAASSEFSKIICQTFGCLCRQMFINAGLNLMPGLRSLEGKKSPRLILTEAQYFRCEK